MEKEYLSYDDVTIVPKALSTVSSRSECNPYDEYGFLPIFASCMDTVVSLDNVRDFNENGIRVVIPRGIPFKDRFDYMYNHSLVMSHNGNFIAYSLDEVKEIFLNVSSEYFTKLDTLLNTSDEEYCFNICIDIANGHMKSMLDIVQSIRLRWSRNNVCIMAGNIANPRAYRYYDKFGVNYVRVGIGGGSGCLTSSNTGVHMPYYTLLSDIMCEKSKINGGCKVVADGNVRGYADIQKALTTSDYVMIGSLFNKAMESAGKTTFGNHYWNVSGKRILRPFKTLWYRGREVPKDKYEKVFQEVKKGTVDVYKQFYGQSTKIAQQKISEANGTKSKLKTAEGLVKYNKVEYDLKGWVENETAYLKSAMSYTDSRTLKEFQEADVIKISQPRFNK